MKLRLGISAELITILGYQSDVAERLAQQLDCLAPLTLVQQSRQLVIMSLWTGVFFVEIVYLGKKKKQKNISKVPGPI